MNYFYFFGGMLAGAFVAVIAVSVSRAAERNRQAAKTELSDIKFKAYSADADARLAQQKADATYKWVGEIHHRVIDLERRVYQEAPDAAQ